MNCAKGYSNEFSIKNNCKTPYCSKLITDWSSFGFEEDFFTLASVSIHKDLFDPIVDPDLIEYNVAKKENEETVLENEESASDLIIEDLMFLNKFMEEIEEDKRN